MEMFGTRRLIWGAALVNVMVGLAAHSRARRLEAATVATEPPEDGERAGALVRDDGPAASRRSVLAVAALVGFAFFAMELVWYRMLAPILGGSSYTFGLILAVALLGIGLGGLLYSLRLSGSRSEPSLAGLAATCGLEALAIAVPFALGDRLALLAAALRPLGAMGFLPLVLGWLTVASVVVLPAAIVAGYQFPLLVALLGRGREGLGRDVGVAYATNTFGALAGCVAGAFLLIPALGAPVLWRSIAIALGMLALVLAVPPRPGSAGRSAVAAAATLLACLLSTLPGPGPVWRHGGIGGGRSAITFDSENGVRRAVRRTSASLVWEAEGKESVVALLDDDGYAFFVNGMSDGNVRGDAPTAVMAGLLSAALHPEPRTALVIGLGTGSTAGWLAAVPSIERVDVVELEPEVVRVARASAAVNHGVLDNPKVELRIGDGRELLMTTDMRYDVVYSNPSNPYRAGVASFFSRDFYREVARRLEDGGVFVQWLQTYEVDADVVRTAYATLSMVFPHVETWRSHTSDVQLVATMREPVHDLDRLARRVAGEPWSTAMTGAWGVEGLEGFLSAFVGGTRLTRGLVGAAPGSVDTDDHPLLEFGFARSAGVRGRFRLDELRAAAIGWDAHRPATRGRTLVDWELVDDLAQARLVAFGWRPDAPADPASPAGLRDEARRAFVERRFREASVLWGDQPQAPRSRIDRLVALTGLALEGLPSPGDLGSGGSDPDAGIHQLEREQPVEALVLLALAAAAEGDAEGSIDGLAEAYVAYRSDPWPHRPLMQYSLEVAGRIAGLEPALGRQLWEALSEPFAAHVLEHERRRTRIRLARAIDFAGLCVEAYEDFEPFPPWEVELLEGRALCYEAVGHERAARARVDVMEYVLAEPAPLVR
jgi:spermidine synthase